MNPNLKSLIVALRSGEYMQAKNQLRTPDNSFCCLGVACNLHALAHPEIAAQQHNPTSYMGSVEILPFAVEDWLGFPPTARCGPRVVIGGSAQVLSSHNDNGKTFLQIADALEIWAEKNQS